MTDKQVIGGRGSAKSYTTLNTIEVMLENEKLKEALKRKEQECEELKQIINEAKNSKLDLKSFLIGEAIQNEYEQQLDQLKAELTRANCQIADDEILQCDMREAIEKLKAENDLAKQLINWILNFFELTDYDWQDDQNEISNLIRDCFDDKQSTIDFVTDINKSLLAKLTDIKEIAKVEIECKTYEIEHDCFNETRCKALNEHIDFTKEILQKISECEGNDETTK